MKVRIQVWITKTHKFRARIQEEEGIPYEVTLGGNEWQKGKGNEHAQQLFKIVAAYLQELTSEFGRVFNITFEEGKTPVGLVKTNDTETQNG